MTLYWVPLGTSVIVATSTVPGDCAVNVSVTGGSLKYAVNVVVPVIVPEVPGVQWSKT